MSPTNLNREDLLAFFIRLSDAFWSGRNPDGSLYCKKHHLNHTGKTSSAMILNLFLYRQTNDSEYLKRADACAEYTLSQLRCDTSNGKEAFYFYPSKSKGNMSNTRIDSGAIIDALATYVKEHPHLSDDAKASYISAIRRVCDTHLVHAATTGTAPPNQHVWAGTGVAAAGSLLDDHILRDASIECVTRTLKEMHPDGFFSYNATPQSYGLPLSAAGITPYYQSRHFAFIFFMLEQIGAALSPYRQTLEVGLAATAATILPDGSKPLMLECKRWYWHSDREAGSYPYDIYVLLKGWRMSGNTTYAQRAALLMSKLMSQQDEAGFVRAAVGHGEEFQCEMMSSSDAVWIVRVWEDLLESLTIRNVTPPLSEEHFSRSGLTRITTPHSTLLLREYSEPCTALWGAGVSGAVPVAYATLQSNKWVSAVPPHGSEWSGTAPGNWFFFPLYAPWLKFLRSFLKNNALDMWHQLYYLRVELGAGNFSAAVHLVGFHMAAMPLHLFLRPFAMQWGDSTRAASPTSNELWYATAPQNRERTISLKARVERKYILNEMPLHVQDKVVCNQWMFWVGLCIPTGALMHSPSKGIRFGKKLFFFFLPAGSIIEITYTYPVPTSTGE